MTDNPYQAPATPPAHPRRWPVVLVMLLVPVLLFAASWWIACKNLDRYAYVSAQGLVHRVDNEGKWPQRFITSVKNTRPPESSSQLLRSNVTAWIHTWYIWAAWLIIVAGVEWWGIRRHKTK